ncbi:MAG TPA: 3-phosphoshikimate 1-carboxyvinyltransferase [Mycobacteriales bacterium]|nr:3-phosphoshikimate 1-carboxyvinyltransferase [Mycobacteriales bacterium]
MLPDSWPAPVAASPVDAVVALPGSKSVTNRALVLAALADGPSRISQPLRSRDTLLMAGGLRVLGIRVREHGDDWVVDGAPGPLPVQPDATVNVGNAGTVMRFLPPVAALCAGPVGFHGDARARARPLGPLLRALSALGVAIDDGATLPVTIRGRGRVRGGAVTVDASMSSQIVSGLLLSGPRYDRGVDVTHEGAPLPSAPHVAMTVAMLRARGVAVDDARPDRWRVDPGPIAPLDLTVEPDLSNAAPFLAAALVTGGRVVVAGWPPRTTQPGALLPTLLEVMGGRAVLTDVGLQVTGRGEIRGIDVDLRDAGELAPVLTAVAALASSPSRLRGIGHLRLHETDRLAALATEIGKLGGDVRVTADGLEVRPAPLHGGVFATYDDHRLATAAAVLGLVVPGVLVENVATTGKTLPGFVELWRRMLR